MSVDRRDRAVERNCRSEDNDAAGGSGVARPAATSRAGTAGRSRQLIQFLTIRQVAEQLNVSTRTVRRWIAAEYLVIHRVGSVVRIADNDLRAFLALHRDI